MSLTNQRLDKAGVSRAKVKMHFERLMQEDEKFKALLGYIGRLCLNKAK